MRNTFVFAALSSMLVGCLNPMERTFEPDPISDFDPPQNVLASDSSFLDRIEISWDFGPGSELYGVYRYGNDSSSYLSVGSTDTNFFADSSIADFRRYYYKVKAYSSLKGWSSFSDFDPGSRARLKPPTGILVSDGTYQDSIVITWSGAIDVGEYRIFRADSTGVFSEAGISDTCRFKDTSVVPLNTYHYRVASYSPRYGSSELSAGDSGYGLESYTYYGALGESSGSFSGLNKPYGIAIDSSSDIFVADFGNNRIVKFDPQGTFIREFGRLVVPAAAAVKGPRGMAFDNDNFLYVASSGDERILKFDSRGAFIAAWGSSGTANGQFNDPHGIFLDPGYRIHVADYGNHRIQVFDVGGGFLSKIDVNANGEYYYRYPVDVAVDRFGRTYASPSKDGFLLVLEPNGHLFSKNTGKVYGIDVDRNGNIGFTTFEFIQKMDLNRRPIALIRKTHIYPQWPAFGDLAFNGRNDILVCDTQGNRVLNFRKKL